MNKDKLSFYASYVAIACGIFLLVMNFYAKSNTTNIVMGLLFLVIGGLGLKKYKNS
jgi:LPXTG-motif cell wall-anchored protein